MTYRDEEEAVQIANGTPYGLAAAVWSGDPQRAERVARRLKAGQVDINGGAFNLLAPFGGCKQSGYGRELGAFGLEEFLTLKSMQFKA
jgi:betaine-aldehyde dehydrogenase